MLIGLNVDPAAEQRRDAFEIATLADAAGIDVIAIQDHPYHRRHLDTWTLLTALTITTTRVCSLTNVANLPLRPPAVLAKAAASLQILSEGRVILGLGAGAQWDAIEAYGGERRRPGEAVDALDEAITVIRSLADPDARSARFDGDHYRLEGARPGPIPDQRLPVWIGAYGPRMLRLTGRRADGWTPSSRFAPPERLGAMQDTVTRAAEEAGRDPSAIRRNYNLMGMIAPDADVEAGEQVVGGSDHWLRTIVGYHDELGVDSIVFWPLEDAAEQCRRFAEEVVPRIRDELGTPNG